MMLTVARADSALSLCHRAEYRTTQQPFWPKPRMRLAKKLQIGFLHAEPANSRCLSKFLLANNLVKDRPQRDRVGQPMTCCETFRDCHTGMPGRKTVVWHF